MKHPGGHTRIHQTNNWTQGEQRGERIDECLPDSGMEPEEAPPLLGNGERVRNPGTRTWSIDFCKSWSQEMPLWAHPTKTFRPICKAMGVSVEPLLRHSQSTKSLWSLGIPALVASALANRLLYAHPGKEPNPGGWAATVYSLTSTEPHRMRPTGLGLQPPTTGVLRPVAALNFPRTELQGKGAATFLSCSPHCCCLQALESLQWLETSANPQHSTVVPQRSGQTPTFILSGWELPTWDSNHFPSGLSGWQQLCISIGQSS